ncbi:MAG: RNA-binding S4 domain-containing protein [Bacteroidales bacterium]|nr:RNA-binding S4 domain-containing protein [Bacteroidales bacterium]
METVRIDKWLWAVRLFKTRSQATEACKGGKVKIDGHHVKPSRDIQTGDEIEIQLAALKKKVKVLQVIKNRVAAKLVTDLAEDLTPAEEYERLDMMRRLNYEKRTRGTGRPTKKDRREIERLKRE